MPRTLRLLIAAWGISPTSAVAEAPPAHASQVTAEEARAVVSRHNEARRAVGATPLAWSPELAAYAQEWADEIARSGVFEHRPRDEKATHFYGENLAVGFGPGYGAAMAVAHWRAEENQYVTGTPIPESPEEFAEFAAGHYTQMVWRATRRVGMGKAVIQTGEMAGWTVFVANYDPAGNAGGQKPY